MFKVFLHSILHLCATSFAFAQVNDTTIAKPDQEHLLWETTVVEEALHGVAGYTMVLKQSIPENETVTSQTQCIGIIIDAETIVTSQACRIALSDENSNNSYKITKIIQNPPGIPLSTQVLRVNPPMILESNFTRPPLIDDNEEYEKFKNQDGFGIVIAMQGPKVGLVRWHDQMTSRTEGGKSVCEENYSVLQKKHPEWPESLPQGIFCIRGGNPNEGNYTIMVKSENVTTEAGLPCEDSMGSPIIIPNEGLLGVVTSVHCQSDPQVAFAQSWAYVETPKNDSTNQTTTQPRVADKTTVFSKIGKPPAFYPIPSQYLAPPFIKVIDPTPSSANHISVFKLAWNIRVLLGYWGLKDSVS